MLKVKRSFFFCLLVMSLVLFSDAAIAGDCKLSAEVWASYMEQDYHTFDQSERGWRRYGPGENFCPLLVAQLIDA